MDVRRIKDPFTALGIATHFLAHRQPFAGFRAAELLATLDGQIRREHYLMAFDGQRMAGFIGWALFDRATADHLVQTRQAPSNEVAARFKDGGDVVWLLTVASVSKAALRSLMTAGGNLYPGKPVLGVRHDPAGGYSLRRLDRIHLRQMPGTEGSA
jgi:hemolysin-activating ACP:hemolysin acyltransferase